MRKFALGLGLISALLAGCTEEASVETPAQVYTHTVEQVGELEIETDSTAGRIPLYSEICEVNGHEFMAILNGFDNSIRLHPLSGKVPEDSIPPRISIDPVTIGNVKSFHFVGDDSIYIATKGPQEHKPGKERELHLIDFQGNLRDSILYADQLSLLVPDGVVNPETEQLFFNQWLPLRVHEGKLFAGLMPYFREDLNRSVSGHFDLSTGKFSYHPLHLDSGSVGAAFVYQLGLRAISPENQTIVLGYRGTPRLKAYHWGEDKVLSGRVDSDFLHLEDPPQPFDPATGGVQGVSQENQLLDNGEYGRILASPDGFFCRFAYFSKQDSLFLEKYGERTNINNRFCSIIVFSHKFRKLTEVSVGDGIIDRNASFSKNGLLYVQDFISAKQYNGRVRYLIYKVEENTK